MTQHHSLEEWIWVEGAQDNSAVILDIAPAGNPAEKQKTAGDAMAAAREECA